MQSQYVLKTCDCMVIFVCVCVPSNRNQMLLKMFVLHIYQHASGVALHR